MQGDSVREGWVIVAPAPNIYQIRGGMFLKISKMLLIFPYRLDKLHRYNLDFQNGLKRMLHTCAAILPETGKCTILPTRFNRIKDSLGREIISLSFLAFFLFLFFFKTFQKLIKNKKKSFFLALSK